MNAQQLAGYHHENRDSDTVAAAGAILRTLHRFFWAPQRVVDIGCGVGTWLKIAKHIWGSQVRGYEHPEVVANAPLVLTNGEILPADFEYEFELDFSCDWGICVEVVEHLTDVAGRNIVAQLCKQCQVVLFSAAVPGQGGNGHINERPLDYWQDVFAEHDYEAIDCIRPYIWNDSRIPTWYRGNTIVYTNPEKASLSYQKMAYDHALRRFKVRP